jgi:hypothetical protein
MRFWSSLEQSRRRGCRRGEERRGEVKGGGAVGMGNSQWWVSLEELRE